MISRSLGKTTRFLVGNAATLATLLAGSHALITPMEAVAANKRQEVASSTIAPAVAGYSKHTLRPRFVVPKGRGRKPHGSRADFQSESYVNTANNLLAASSTNIAGPTPGPGDLAQTDDVVLTTAIRDRATALGNNPVQIYNWVRDHVVFTPTYGSIQGADATLQTLRGNAFDTASLLIALMRASNIPARYVYGTIEVPVAAAENWVGNVKVPEAAVALFDQGGIPVQGVVSGGVVSAIQVEHVWVEAYLDFNPSRAAVNRAATTWVPLDASFKQYRYTPGLDVRGGVTLDAATLGAQIEQGATLSSDGVTSLNTSGMGDAFNDFASRAASYIGSNKANASVADVLGSQAAIAEDLPLLAGALPYKTIAVGSVYSDLPSTLRWQIQYGVYASDFDRTQNNALASIAQSLPTLVGKRLTLSFGGATSGDAGKLASALNSNPLPTTVAGAAIQMTAHLTLDGQAVANGGSVALGTALVGGLGIFDPQVGDWTYTADSRVLAGETHSFAFAGQAVAAATLASSRDRLAAFDAQISARQYGALTQDAFVGELLNYAALSYATTLAGNSELMCTACGIVSYALPTIVRVDTRANATYSSGLPLNVSFPGVSINVEALGRTAVAADNNAARALAFQRTYGEHASAYTHLLLDALFTDSAHTGITASTVRALKAANAAGSKIFLLTANNSASIVPQLNIDPATVAVLQDATGAGRTATISQSPVTIGNWSGAGYVLEDPGIGSGDYEITGRDEADLSVSGGWLPLALAGTAFTVQGDAAAAAVQAVEQRERSYYSAAVALLADYGSVAWSNFVAAPLVVSQWWLCALWDGLPAILGDPGTSIVSTISVGDFTILPGAPTTNNPPYFTSAAVTSAAVNQPYQYLAAAVDPDGDLLTYKLTSGPSGMSVSATTGLVNWASPITGIYPVTIRVSDGTNDVDQSYTLTVGTVLPLDFSLGITPQFVNVGDIVTITLATTGGSGTITKTLSVDSANVPLDANGQAKVTAQSAGAHAVVATVSDNQTTLTRNSAYGVQVAGDTSAPAVQITAPADGAVLTAPTPVNGGVADANLLYWQLLLSPSGQAQWKELARGVAPVNGSLGTFDTTQLANGQYDLNLVAFDVNGRSSSAVVQVIVQGDLKLGLFTVSFNDLQLDVGGIPLTVTRTYDSRKKDAKGDFGYGWSLSYQNVNLQRNRPLGETWETYQQGLLTFCVRPIGKRTVSIALSDGKVHQFDVVASPQCETGQVPDVITMAFTPRPGTTSSLAVLDGGDLLFQGSTVYDSGTGDTYDSRRYLLTTLDNYKYVLSSNDGKTFQVVQITDPNGEVLTLTAQGVTSSNGAALSFTRDAQNRIIKAADPAGRTVAYAYTSAGDLDTITNPLHQVARNEYANAPAALAHLLTSYTDPSGTLQLKNEYDATGKLIAQYDALGNKVDFSQRDLTGHTQAVTDRRGYTTTYTFDDNGDITQIADPLGGVTTSKFDVYGNETEHTDPLHRTSSTIYDAPSGTVLKQTDALGHSTSSAWNFYTINGNHTPQMLQSTTDELGHQTTFSYTAPGMLNVISDPLGHKTQFGWCGAQFDQLCLLTDPTGKVTSYQNDSLGRKTQETDPLGNVTKYTYDAAGRLLTTTKTRVVNGQTETLTTTNTVDANGNVLSTTDPLGHVTQSTWTAQQQLATQTDPLGRVTRYGYDLSARPTQTTYPDGSTEATGYDANGNAVTQTDRGGRVTKTDYDELNRPTVVTFPDHSFTTTHYDAAGQVAWTMDEIQRTTNYQYDAAGRKTDAIDPASHATHYGYDDAGKLTSVTDALNHTTTYVYDEANRRTQTTWPDLTFTSYGYDNAGRKTSETDPAQHKTQYHYDADGRLDQVTDALSRVTSYGYDELGDKTRQTDALGHVTSWGYDSLGRATNHTLPDSRFETMGYDVVGRLINKTDYAGDAVGYQYDQADRITKQTFVDGSAIATSYTASGQIATLTLIANGSSTITRYTYDDRDRLTDVVYPDNAKLHYVYDTAGQKTQQTITAPDGQSQTIDYTYDAAGNLWTVSANAKIFTYHYDEANRKIARDDPNGLVTAYHYDANGRLESWVTTNGSGAGAAVVSQGTYTLNAAGQRTGLSYVGPDTQTRTLAYGYDGAGRLTSEARSLPSHTTNWVLDEVGNRKTQTLDGQTGSYAYDTADRLTGITGAGAATYAWDQNGQLQAKTVGTAKTSYTFNAQHLLSGATLADGTAIRYQYGPDGNIALRAKTSGGSTQTTNYLVDPNLAFAQVVAEYDTAGHASAIYVYGDELLLRIKPGQASPNTYYHHDGLGSVVALTSDSGAAVETYGYDAWGNAAESTGTDDSPYGYTGQRRDADTGLIYLRARWYDPGVGRFVSSDPARGNTSLPASLNKYLYALGEPISYTDPTGLETLVGLNSSIASNAIGSAIARTAARVTINNIGGKAFERYVGTLLQRFVAQYGGTVARQVYLRGPGGLRVADYVVTLGKRFVIIEAKTGIPLAGQALARFGGQLATYAAQTTIGNTELAEVIVITEESAADIQASFLLVESQVAQGTLSGVLQGTNGLMLALRGILLGL